jgi:hypothetical protein
MAARIRMPGAATGTVGSAYSSFVGPYQICCEQATVHRLWRGGRGPHKISDVAQL